MAFECLEGGLSLSTECWAWNCLCGNFHSIDCSAHTKSPNRRTAKISRSEIFWHWQRLIQSPGLGLSASQVKCRAVSGKLCFKSILWQQLSIIHFVCKTIPKLTFNQIALRIWSSWGSDWYRTILSKGKIYFIPRTWQQGLPIGRKSARMKGACFAFKVWYTSLKAF